MVVGSRFGLTIGISQVEVYASAAAKAAVLEAERAAQIAAGLPDDLVHRPTRLSELLVVHADRADIHAVLRDVAEAQAELHALQAAAISRLAALQPAQSPLPGGRPDDPDGRADDWVTDEVACVLGISTSTATTLVGKQRALVEQLPQVWAALAEGRIDVRRATVLVDALAHRKQSAGGGLPDHVVDAIARRGLAWIGEGAGPTPLADRVAGALVAADPAEADRRAEQRRTKQNTTTTGTGDGLATFRSDHLDADQAAQMQTVVDAMAATMRKNGDRRPIGVLRVVAHHQLVTRPWQALPDDVAAARWNLHLRVDLTDLDDGGPLQNTSTPAATERTDDTELTNQATASACDQHGMDTDAPTGAADPSDDGGEGRVVWSDDGDGRSTRRGSRVGAIGGLPVPPAAVAELLARYAALIPTGPHGRVEGGHVWFEVVDSTGRLCALTTPAEARAALRRGTGLGPPPAVDRYTPSAEQVRFVKARDRHCRFPGCHRPAHYVDLDHVIPHDHRRPHAGGPTCVTNLICLCRRHHRLKTHAPGWTFQMDPDGTLHVTPPGSPTRTTRPAHLAEAGVTGAGVTGAGVAGAGVAGASVAGVSVAGSTQPQVDALVDVLGPTPKRYRTPTPQQRAARRAATDERARLAAQIDADLDAALTRAAAGLPLWPTSDDFGDADGGTVGCAGGTGSSTAPDADQPPF
ncbi:HNH endonuclease signature motif containing protein [Klenkia marina]|nr:HNH endonuclease signature motif containing protein [Klenkia marina]